MSKDIYSIYKSMKAGTTEQRDEVIDKIKEGFLSKLNARKQQQRSPVRTSIAGLSILNSQQDAGDKNDINVIRSQRDMLLIG